jgi:hypothetical protein
MNPSVKNRGIYLQSHFSEVNFSDYQQLVILQAMQIAGDSTKQSGQIVL